MLFWSSDLLLLRIRHFGEIQRINIRPLKNKGCAKAKSAICQSKSNDCGTFRSKQPNFFFTFY